MSREAVGMERIDGTLVVIGDETKEEWIRTEDMRSLDVKEYR